MSSGLGSSKSSPEAGFCADYCFFMWDGSVWIPQWPIGGCPQRCPCSDGINQIPGKFIGNYVGEYIYGACIEL